MWQDFCYYLMFHTRKQIRRFRQILQILVIVLVWQFAFPQNAFAQSQTMNPEATPEVTIILPVDQPLTPAVPLATVVPVRKPAAAYKVAKVKTVVMTAYTSTKDQCDSDPYTTASGAKVRDGVIAMNGVPFGTKIRIPEKFGSKVFVVQDRMHARYGSSRADIWMKNRNAAKQWGVRRVKVEILK
jgi:3D (Asp-Asp-Asp) domain-containing protein